MEGLRRLVCSCILDNYIQGFSLCVLLLILFYHSNDLFISDYISSVFYFSSFSLLGHALRVSTRFPTHFGKLCVLIVASACCRRGWGRATPVSPSSTRFGVRDAHYIVGTTSIVSTKLILSHNTSINLKFFADFFSNI